MGKVCKYLRVRLHCDSNKSEQSLEFNNDSQSKELEKRFRKRFI